MADICIISPVGIYLVITLEGDTSIQFYENSLSTRSQRRLYQKVTVSVPQRHPKYEQNMIEFLQRKEARNQQASGGMTQIPDLNFNLQLFQSATNYYFKLSTTTRQQTFNKN